MEFYVNILESKIAQCRQEHGDLADDNTSYLNMRPEMPPFSDEGDDADYSSTDSDEDRAVEELRALKARQFTPSFE